MTPPATSRGAGTGPSDRSDVAERTPPRAEPARVTLLLFAAAREAAGCSRCELAGATVSEVLEQARQRFGSDFGAILDGSRVWVNGEPVSGPEPLHRGDEVAVLPPVSGG
jgi:molybdopterin synthase sulfur carrier subunit